MRETYSTQLAIVVGTLIFITAVIFALVQSPEVFSVPGKSGASIPHTAEGHERCGVCHGPKGLRPYPERHRGWSEESCIRCHAPAGPERLSGLSGTPGGASGS